MGTINYGTSKYITLGYNCNNIDYDEPFYNDFIMDYYEQIAITLNKYTFNYFSVTLEPGYYEGYYINIEFNYLWLDSCEKREAQKEITQIKQFLLQCVNDFECIAVFPGWCTGYADHNQTLTKLKNAIQEMRQTVRNAKYNKLGVYA